MADQGGTGERRPGAGGLSRASVTRSCCCAAAARRPSGPLLLAPRGAGEGGAGRGGAGLETRRVARVARRGRGLANCRGGSGLRYADRSGLRYERLDSGAWARTAAISTRALARA